MSTCQNWSNPGFTSAMAYAGSPYTAWNSMFANGYFASCGFARMLYCVEP